MIETITIKPKLPSKINERVCNEIFVFSCHIPAVHPEKAKDYIKERTIRRRLWKEDYANRSKIQCFICDYAGSKASHLKRHYTEVHGYEDEFECVVDTCSIYSCGDRSSVEHCWQVIIRIVSGLFCTISFPPS